MVASALILRPKYKAFQFLSMNASTMIQWAISGLANLVINVHHEEPITL